MTDEMIGAVKKVIPVEVVAFGLGPTKPIVGMKILSIPYFRLDTLPNNWGSNILFNLLFQIPLVLLSMVFYLVIRPKVVFANGFTAPMGVMPLAKIFGSKVVIYSNTYLQRATNNPLRTWLIRRLNFLIDTMFVNSKGSFDDLAFFFDPTKIMIIEHWTKISKVSPQKRRRLRMKLSVGDKFVLLFLGKRSKEKGCDILLEVMEKLVADKRMVYWFIGPDGNYSQQIDDIVRRHDNVRNFGFIKDDKDVRNYIVAADLVWSFADETYLALPAIEALACGTPIIVPDRPAVSEKWGKAKIPLELIPKPVGWIVESEETGKIVELIKKLVGNRNVVAKMRSDCLEEAVDHHSFKNVQKGAMVVKAYLLER